MAYCRWSSDNWNCDVYAYEAENGYHIHVAANRYPDGSVPIKPAWGSVSTEEWFDAHNKQLEVIQTISTVKIGGPFDGESFVCGDLDSFLARMRVLSAWGYRIPEMVFDEIENEILESAVS